MHDVYFENTVRSKRFFRLVLQYSALVLLQSQVAFELYITTKWVTRFISSFLDSLNKKVQPFHDLRARFKYLGAR